VKKIIGGLVIEKAVLGNEAVEGAAYESEHCPQQLSWNAKYEITENIVQ
jgi:hypothetical protein